MERESQYTISSVKTALKVLKLFDSAHKSMTLTENTERADMRKGTMVRVLTTQEEGFVRYDEISKRYSLGMSIYVLSSNAFQFISVVEAARHYPGDIIFGDLDGVLVIPKEIEEEVIVRAIEKAAGEKMVAEAIKNGMAAKASFDKYGIM